MSEHAILAPSSAHRWMTCLASLAMELGRPNRSSKFADEGTAAHELGAMCLVNGVNTSAYAGRMLLVGDTSYEVNDEMEYQVQKYVDAIRGYAKHHALWIEERIDFSRVVEYPESFGTGDAVIVDTDAEELQIHDLKYGRGVEVSAEYNEQLMIYALGALEIFAMIYSIKRVRLVIHQVRLRDEPEEWVMSIEKIRAFAKEVREKAKAAIYIRNVIEQTHPNANDVNPVYFAPNEDNCRFCRAAGVCRAQDKLVEEIVNDKDRSLSDKLNYVEFVENWAKAVKAEGLNDLLSQKKVPGWMLVEGRRGDRKFSDEDKAERILSAALTPDEVFERKLIGVSKAEKLLKKNAPETWARLSLLITQSEGRPSIAREKEGRVALTVKPPEDVFDNLDQGGSPWAR